MRTLYSAEKNQRDCAQYYVHVRIRNAGGGSYLPRQGSFDPAEKHFFGLTGAGCC